MVIDTSALLASADITTVPLGESHVHWAPVGWRRFGKGQHRAALNFGDCFSYGLAMALEAPLLFKGADFAASDVQCALTCAHKRLWRMRTTLELPDPLFARLKARAASERVTLKHLLRSYVEQGLSAAPECARLTRSAATLPRLDGPLAIEDHQLSNAALFELLDP
jgi:hypothetical protein